MVGQVVGGHGQVEQHFNVIRQQGQRPFQAVGGFCQSLLAQQHRGGQAQRLGMLRRTDARCKHGKFGGIDVAVGKRPGGATQMFRYDGRQATQAVVGAEGSFATLSVMNCLLGHAWDYEGLYGRISKAETCIAMSLLARLSRLVALQGVAGLAGTFYRTKLVPVSVSFAKAVCG